MDIDLTHPTLPDLRARAKRRLPHFAWEYLDSGTGDDAAIRRSRAALDAVALAPAVLKGRTVPDLSATLLGRDYSRPWGVSPVGAEGEEGDAVMKSAYARRTGWARGRS